MRELKIFSGQANRPLAKSICNFLHLPLAEITLGKFPDGENFCKIEEDIRGRDIFLARVLAEDEGWVERRDDVHGQSTRSS